MAIARLAALGSLLALSTAFAQPYPTKPVRVIVPSAAGGPNDTIMRAVAQPLSQTLGQSVIVENRGGAEGIIGAEACARAPPDGYLLCATAINVITYTPVLRSKLPYDPPRDFIPVAHLGFSDAAIVVHQSVPVNSVQELIALAKAKPEAITWAAFGNNTSSYYYMEWLRRTKGAVFLPVPYKTSQQTIQALAAGESLAMYVGLQAMMPVIRAGKAKALAVTGDQRQAFLPEVPTLKEAGIEPLPIRTWYGVFTPAGTPRDVVMRLNGEIVKIMSNPAFIERFMTSTGLTPANVSADEFSAFVKRDRAAFEEMARVLQLKVE